MIWHQKDLDIYEEQLEEEAETGIRMSFIPKNQQFVGNIEKSLDFPL
jgi:hypothetical protein